MNRNRQYLLDLQAEIELLERFTADGEQAFYDDERTQYAVMMAYARIGEIAKRLPDDLLATRPEAEWRRIKDFRDILLHRYSEIDASLVWLSVAKLPVLKTAVEALLSNLADES